jgi:hypothetical protein
LTHEYFATLTQKQIADADKTCEVLLALSRDSREEVDAVKSGFDRDAPPHLGQTSRDDRRGTRCRVRSGQAFP